MLTEPVCKPIKGFAIRRNSFRILEAPPMKQFTALLVLTGATSLLGLASATAAPMPSSAGLGKQVVTVTQNVGQDNMSAVRASVAPLVNSTKGYGNNVSAIAVASPSAIATIAPVPVYPGMRESAILATATSHFKANGPALAVRMGSWMKQNGLAFGWFTYTQKIMLSIPKAAGTVGGNVGGGGGGSGGGGSGGGNIEYQQMLMMAIDDGSEGGGGGGGGGTPPNASALAPATEERLLVWTMNTDQNGRLLFGNPIIVPPRPKTLYVIYTPRAVEKGLPDGWKYPNAGTLFVQTRDENHVPIPGTDERIDVGGAFDEPTEVLGTTSGTAPPHDADGAIPCLMNHNAGGCYAGVSVRSLMDDRGANMAVVDYLRKVQPVYDEGADGELVPRGSLNVTKREIRYNGCADVLYHNEGNYMFELQSTATRYLLSPSGSYGAVGESTFSEISPTVAYTGQLVVQASDSAKLASHIINPVDPADPKLMAIADVTATSIAPMTTTGNPRGTLVYSTTGYISTGSNNLSAHVYVGCDMSKGTLAVSAGWQDAGSDVASNWTPNVNKYTIGTEFLKGTPGGGGLYTREDPQHGYCSGSVSYDGNRGISVSMSAGCAFGEQLIGGNVFSADGQTLTTANDGLASLFPQYCSIGSSGGASGETPVPYYDAGSGKWTTTLVGNSRWGCVYNYSTGGSMSSDSVMSGSQNPCGSNLHSGIFFDKVSTPVPGDPTKSTTTYGGKACVAHTTSTWSLGW
jgi:hypothetical protein